MQGQHDLIASLQLRAPIRIGQQVQRLVGCAHRQRLQAAHLQQGLQGGPHRVQVGGRGGDPPGLAVVGQVLRAGVEGADSWSVDAHKWLFTTFDCSCLWLADARPLEAIDGEAIDIARRLKSDCVSFWSGVPRDDSQEDRLVRRQ